ncbi:MAG: sugar ABC transporter permease [Fimbriimonadaceae bacterium]|nr:sugar ABC transporter permease [Fimbriimonadaceae bacterium]
MNGRKRNNLSGWLFVSPWVIGFLAFTLWPFLQSVYLSFTRYNILSSPKWVGGANYNQLFTQDDLFWRSLWVTVKYALVAVPLGIVAGVALALLLNINVRGMTVFRAIFFLPSIVPTVAVSVVFMWLLNPTIGLVNTVLRAIGIEGPSWLSQTPWAFNSLILLGLWGVGGSMVIYLAGLKDVPTHLYEAAVIDGANAWQRTRKITLPMLTPVIFFNLVMGIIGSFQYFTQAFVMTRGGPEDSTMFYAMYLFNRAWKYQDMGYASAMAWVLFVVVVALTAIVFKSQKRWVHYGG